MPVRPSADVSSVVTSRMPSVMWWSSSAASSAAAARSRLSIAGSRSFRRRPLPRGSAARPAPHPARLGGAHVAHHPLAVVLEVRLRALGEREVRVGLARALAQLVLRELGLGGSVLDERGRLVVGHGRLGRRARARRLRLLLLLSALLISAHGQRVLVVSSSTTSASTTSSSSAELACPPSLEAPLPD